MKPITKNRWSNYLCTFIMAQMLISVLQVSAQEITINVGVANKLEVALAVGPTEVDYSTFESDLRAILANKFTFTPPLISQYNPPVSDHDLIVTAAKAVSANTTSEFSWWVYDHTIQDPNAATKLKPARTDKDHNNNSFTGYATYAAFYDYLSGQANLVDGKLWNTATAPSVAELKPYRDITAPYSKVSDVNHTYIEYNQSSTAQTSSGSAANNQDKTSPDYNTTRHPYDGRLFHMVESDNGATMDFYGYGQYSYKDFRYLPNDQKTIKTFEFAIAEDIAYDALDGVGFFFNMDIQRTYESGLQTMSGYLLFLHYGNSTNTTTQGKGIGMALYKFQNINVKDFHQSKASTSTNYGGIDFTVANSFRDRNNNGFTKVATASYPGNDLSRRIKIEAAPEKVQAWYVGNTAKNHQYTLTTPIADYVMPVAPITWTMTANGEPGQQSGTTTSVHLSNSIITNYGFGPMSSYWGHGCARPTHIALQNLSMTMDKVRSLTEVVREPDWTENTKKFLVNLNENEIEDFSSTSITGELLNRLRNDDIYYIGWCSNANATKSQEFLTKNDLKGEIVNINAAGTTTYEAQMKAIADEIYKRYWIQADNVKPIVLVNDQVDLNVAGADRTNTADPVYPSGKWKIVHSDNGFDTPDGAYPLSGQFVSDLDLQFSRVGIYDIYFREQHVISIIAHKAPVAAFNVTLNGNKPSFEDKSYDPDDLTAGIVSSGWSYLNIEEDDAKLVKVSSIDQLETELAMLLLGGKTYLVILDVVDKYGATASIAKQIRYVASYDPEAVPAVTGVTVTPAVVSVEKGAAQQFTAILTVEGVAEDLETVVWSVSGNNLTGTYINPTTGLLTVDVGETAAALIVAATSVFDPTKQGSATATLTDETVTAEVIAVIVTPLAPSVEKGETQQFTANVATQGGASESVLWSISGNKAIRTSIDPTTGLLTVSTGETAATLTVTATSTVDGKKYGSATVTVVDPPEVISVEVVPSIVDVRQGNSQQFAAILTVMGNASESVEWSISGNESIPNTYITTTGELFVAADETAATITVTATSVFNNMKQGSATVTVKLSSESVTSKVIAVSVTPSAPSVYKGTTLQFAANVATQGGASEEVEWSVEGGISSISETGLLKIAASETAATLTVTATSTVDGSKYGTTTVTVTESTFEPPFGNFDIYPYTILKGVGNQNITLTNNSYDLQGLAVTSDFTVKKKDETPVNFTFEEGSDNDVSSLGSGEYVITLVVNNGFKNSVPVTRSFSIVEDKILPTASASPSTANFPTNTAVTLTFSDTGGSGLKEQRVIVTTSSATPSPGDLAWTPSSVSSTRSVTINIAGTTYIHWEAIDNAGNSNSGYFGPYTLTKQPISLALTADPVSVTYPDPITLTATLTYDALGILPTDPVYFFIGETNIGSAPIVDGEVKYASLAYTPTLAGNVIFSAKYLALYDNTYNSADASINYTIHKSNNASVTVGVQTNKIYDGAPFVPTGISVTGANSHEVSYSGRDGTTYNSTTPPTDAGKYAITVTTTDPGYVVKTQSADFEIYKRVITLSLSASPAGNANAMSNVTLTATIGNLVDVPVGKVKFSQDGTQIGSDTAIEFDGAYSAVLTWTSVPAKVYNLKAEYIAAAGDNYTVAADATISGYTVAKQNQTGFGFTDASPITKSIIDDDFTITANGGQTLGSIRYEVTEGSDVISVNSATGEITILKIGTAVITATKPGDDAYHTAVVTLTINIGKNSNVSASIGAQTDKIYDAVPFVVTGISVTEGIGYEIKYTGRNGTIYDSSVSPVNAGKYTVTVTTTDPNFVEKTASADFEISKRVLTLSLTANPAASAIPLQDIALSATIENVISSPLAIPSGIIKFSANDVVIENNCTISLLTGNIYQAVSFGWQRVPGGEYNIKAEYIPAANDNYTVSQPATIIGYVISKKDQIEIKFSDDGGTTVKTSVNKTYGDDPLFTIPVVGGQSGASVVYSVTSGSDVVSVSSTGVAVILKAGNAVITATKPEDGEYNSTSATLQVTVNKRPITIKAEDETIDYGDIPVLAYSITSGNLVNGDALSGSLAADNMTAGANAIEQGTLTAGDNYLITFIGGVLTVNNMLSADITDLTVDGRPVIQGSDNTFRVVAECGSTQTNINVTADPAATIEINGVLNNPQIVNLPKYGDNIFNIAVTTKNNSQTYTIIVTRYYDQVMYEYPDIPTVNCNLKTNGGYVFTAFQWYRESAAISGANKAYYRINDDASYYCEITLSDGSKWRTCVIQETTRTASSLKAYPNPTQGEVTVSNDEQLSTGKIQVFDMYGRLVLQPYTNPFDMSTLPEGVYVIKINDETVRVVVKK